MNKITVLTIADRIACFHSLKPFLFCKAPAQFTFTLSPEFCLRRDKNRILVMMRQFIKPDRVDLDLMKALRKKYERIAFFHDDAGGGIPRLEVLPHTDLFYSKALFRDRELYKTPLYGKELYSDYFHKKYGVTDPDWRERPVVTDSRELDKLRLSWNIGIGDYPRDKLRQRAGYMTARYLSIPAVKPFYRRRQVFRPEANRGLYPAHCRIGMISRPSINFQRARILERITGNPDFLTGSVGQAAFNREIRHAKITVSPFGWGELCLRDFEAVQNGSLLLKPDMSHLETWPDVFLPGETYVPFDWDGRTLAEKTRAYLENDAERGRIAANAFRAYSGALSELDARFNAIIGEILS